MTIEEQIAAELDATLLQMHADIEAAADKLAEYKAIDDQVASSRSRAQQLRLATFSLQGQSGGTQDADIANAKRLEQLLAPPVEEPPAEEEPEQTEPEEAESPTEEATE